MGSTARAIERSRARRVRTIALASSIIAALLIALVVVLATRGGDDGSAADGTVLEVDLGDYFIGGELTAPAGRVQLHATNIGVEPHDVGMAAVGPGAMPKITSTLFKGQDATLDLGELPAGTYQLFCDVSDHIARGMVATLTITEPVPTTP
jgi:hypothetical protein